MSAIHHALKNSAQASKVFDALTRHRRLIQWWADEVIFSRHDQIGFNFGQSVLPHCRYDWARHLTSLRLLCETGQGHPHPNPLR